MCWPLNYSSLAMGFCGFGGKWCFLVVFCITGIFFKSILLTPFAERWHIYMRPMNKAKDWVLSLIIVAYLRVRHPIFGHFCRSNLFTIVAWCPKRMANNIHQRCLVGVCWRNQQVQLLEMKFIDVQCLLLFLNTYSLWQCSTSVENALLIFVYVYLYIYIYRDIIYTRFLHTVTVMVKLFMAAVRWFPVPWRIPRCTHETTPSFEKISNAHCNASSKKSAYSVNL